MLFIKGRQIESKTLRSRLNAIKEGILSSFSHSIFFGTTRFLWLSYRYTKKQRILHENKLNSKPFLLQSHNVHQGCHDDDDSELQEPQEPSDKTLHSASRDFAC